MIFYGSRASRIKDGRVNNVSCPDCNEITSFNYSVFGKFAHVYWIPFFPMGKESVLECNNCKRTYKAGQLPENIQHKFKNEWKEAKTPIWNYSGLGVVALIICLVIYWTGVDKENQTQYIQDPQIGDVYSTKSSTAGMYTAMKVTEVTADSIQVIFSDYEVDKRTGISQVDRAAYYTDQYASFSKAYILSLFEEETIYDIDRD